MTGKYTTKDLGKLYPKKTCWPEIRREMKHFFHGYDGGFMNPQSLRASQKVQLYVYLPAWIVRSLC